MPRLERQSPQEKGPGQGPRPSRRLALFLCFLLLFLLGIALGEPARVLEQARSICLACIGIG